MHHFVNTIKCSPKKHNTHERRSKHKTNYIAAGIRDVRPAKIFFSGKIVAYQELFKRQKRENKQNKSSELAAKFFLPSLKD